MGGLGWHFQSSPVLRLASTHAWGVCMYVCMYVCVCVCVCGKDVVCVWVRFSLCVCMYVCMYVCVYAWDILVYWFMGMGMHMSSLVHGYALHLTLPNPSPMVGNLMG